MRTVPSGLATRLATGSSSTCFVLSIERKDGTILRFAESDIDLSVGGQTYSALPGLMLGSIPYGLDGFSSGVDIQFGATNDTPITLNEIRDGMFDAGEVAIYEVDFTIPEAGGVQVFWGRVTDVERTVEGKAKIEAKGVLAQTYQIVVEHYNPMCLWFFCDSRCGLNPDDYTYTGTITAIPDNYTLTLSGAVTTRPDDAFKDGVYTITSGAREGLNIEVRHSAGALFETFLAHPRGLQVGDTISALQGCQKRFVDCQAYGNQLRFGGQPYAGAPENAQAITYREWQA